METQTSDQPSRNMLKDNADDPSCNSSDSDTESASPASAGHLRCTHCSFTTKHGRRLREHMDRHNLPKVIQCPFCPFSIDWDHKQQFKFHLFNHLEEELKCSLCPFKTQNMNYLQKHYKTHKTMLTCTHCPYTTRYSDCYEEHIAKHVIKQREEAGELTAKECPACEQVFKTKPSLKKHLATHTENSVSCRYCSFKTSNMRNLQRHALKRHLVST